MLLAQSLSQRLNAPEFAAEPYDAVWKIQESLLRATQALALPRREAEAALREQKCAPCAVWRRNVSSEASPRSRQGPAATWTLRLYPESWRMMAWAYAWLISPPVAPS